MAGKAVWRKVQLAGRVREGGQLRSKVEVLKIRLRKGLGSARLDFNFQGKA